MRLLTYILLTQVILLLAHFRERVVRYYPEQVHKDRVFDVYSLESWSCCDCGLTHRFLALSDPDSKPCNHVVPIDGLTVICHCWPIRPKGYKYNLRFSADKPSLAIEK